VLVLAEAGRLDQAEELARGAHAATARARLPLPQLWFANGLGRVQLLRGRPVQAARWFREQLALSRELGQKLPFALAAAGLLTAGGWLEGTEVLAEAAAAWDAAGMSDDDPTMLPADLAVGAAWRRFRDGDLEVHLGVEEPEFVPARKAHPAFLVQNLATLRERIETAGYRVTDDVPLEGFYRCHVRDPFGNRIELVEPVSQ